MTNHDIECIINCLREHHGRHQNYKVTPEGVHAVALIIDPRVSFKQVKHAMRLRGEDGKFIPFAWPGGAALYYYDKDGGMYCVDCANQEDAEPPIVDGDTYEEGPPRYCDGCNKELPSEYGDPDEEDTEEGEVAGI